MLWKKILFLVILICFPLFSIHSSQAAETCWNVMMFGSGNTDQWEKDLNLHDIRVACSGDPTRCLENRLNPTTGTIRKYDRIFLGITREKSKAADYALQYSELSKKYPKLYEISFDDFYTFWIGELGEDNIELKKIIDNTKKINPNLKFGMTLYQDQLSLLDNITLTNRRKVDYIHLFLHDRKTNIEGDVQQVKILFPNAKIIAGSYAFDFKSPCTEAVSDHEPCRDSDELTYFKESLERQTTLMKNCKIEAIEFWPAYFGNENQIDFTACLAKGNTSDQCITNTKKMRSQALKIFNSIKPSPTLTLKPTSTPTLSPTSTLTPTNIISKCTQCLGLPKARGKGDANCDGEVDVIDYSLWYKNFQAGHLGTDIKNNWNADFTCDGLVDIIDYSLWYQYFKS
ncbi:MAG: dockerin type I repeat-containing protein [Candidatus Shapirobacteria bacterium]